MSVIPLVLLDTSVIFRDSDKHLRASTWCTAMPVLSKVSPVTGERKQHGDQGAEEQATFATAEQPPQNSLDHQVADF